MTGYLTLALKVHLSGLRSKEDELGIFASAIPIIAVVILRIVPLGQLKRNLYIEQQDGQRALIALASSM
jgi:hypothetical protein